MRYKLNTTRTDTMCYWTDCPDETGVCDQCKASLDDNFYTAQQAIEIQNKWNKQEELSVEN